MLPSSRPMSSSSASSDIEELQNSKTTMIKMEGLTDDDSNAAEVVLSNKGGPKVIHKGFMYTLHKKQPNNIRWRCVGRTLHCRGSLITTSECKKPRIRMQHNHNPDFAAAQLARKRYIALGQPPVLYDNEPRPQTKKSRNLMVNNFSSWADWSGQDVPQWQHQLPAILPKAEEESARVTRSSSRNSNEISPTSDWQDKDHQPEQSFLPALQKELTYLWENKSLLRS